MHVKHKCTCTILLSGEGQQTPLDQDGSQTNVLVLLKGCLMLSLVSTSMCCVCNLNPKTNN